MSVRVEQEAPSAVRVDRQAASALRVEQTVAATVAVDRVGPAEVQVDSPGVPGPPGPVAEVYIFNQPGRLTPATGRSRVYLEADSVLATVRLAVGLRGSGDTTVQLCRNGTGLLTLVLAAATDSVAAAPGLQLAAGDFLTVNLLAADGVMAAQDLTLTCRLLHA